MGEGNKILYVYISNVSRCVSSDDCKFIKMKSHDYHVFILRFLPIDIHELMPNDVWDALNELNSFFRELFLTEIYVKNMEVLKNNIVITLCKPGKIFTSAFFYSMEHLPVNLACEAKVLDR